MKKTADAAGNFHALRIFLNTFSAVISKQFAKNPRIAAQPFAASFGDTKMKFVALLLFSLITVHSLALPSFPGAEGSGGSTPGGRGGTVFHVTTTNDNGSSSLAGSLRQGVSVGNRTIVFDVSGTINLVSDLKISVTNLTIAGQTAPGDGIATMGSSFMIQNTHDVMVRYLRCRPGDLGCPAFQGDSFDFVNATNVMADHISATWSVDECMSPTWSTNVTFQWCLIGESMKNSCHIKGQHGYGSLMRYGQGQITLHHNLYAHNDSRNPRPGDNMHLDFVNNVVYDWGNFCGYNANDSPDNLSNGGLFFTNVINYVSNCFVAGPNTGSHITTAFASGVTNALQCQIFQAGNYLDSNKNSALDGGDTGWAMFSAPYTQLGVRYAAPPITTDSPLTAYERVLAFAGASLLRDAADARIIRTTRAHAGKIIDYISAASFSGDYVTNTAPDTYTTNTTTGVITTNYYNFIGVNPWPALVSKPAPLDTDQDGMPNFWEQNLGLNPGVANNNHTNASGYTDLEDYLNFLGAPHNFGGVNGINVTDLRVLTGNDTNQLFTIANATNGIITLAGDGLTAQFFPATNFIGLAYFTFNATNAVNHSAFGPVLVTLLVTNLAPVISAQPAGTTNNLGATTTFSVAAVNAALDFQWQKNGINLLAAGNILGAVTNATLTFTNLTGANAGNYSVVVSNFSGVVTSSVATLAVVSNTAPALSAISDRTVIAGAVLTFASSASDGDLPAQTLTFSSLNFPANAAVNPSNGIFIWRPAIAQGGVTNLLKIIVTDNGSPNLSATQAFSVAVLNPATPQLQNPVFTNGFFRVAFTGDAGPDYWVQSSTNLAGTNWTTVFTTNAPALPVSWMDLAATNFNQRFYRIQLAP